MRSGIVFAFGLCLVSSSLSAQTATPPAETLKAARDLVAQTQGNRDVVIRAMVTPMIGFVQQIGVKEPDRAQVLVQEVLLPIMTEHFDSLLDRQAQTYAQALSLPDLQAISAFYATPAGRDFLAAQPVLGPAMVRNVTLWVSEFAPEIRTKVTEAAAAHGWGAASKAN